MLYAVPFQITNRHNKVFAEGTVWVNSRDTRNAKRTADAKIRKMTRCFYWTGEPKQPIFISPTESVSSVPPA